MGGVFHHRIQHDFVTPDGTHYYGASGTSFTLAQVDAGTATGIPGTQFTNFNPYVFFDGGANVVLNSGQAAFAYTVPTGAANLPATLNMGTPSAIIGSAVQIPWTGTGESGLNYSQDGGALTAAGGTVTGNAGTATGPMLSTQGFHTIYLESASNTLDVTPPQVYSALAKPSGAGTLTFSASGTLVGASSTGTLAIPNGPYAKIYVAAAFQTHISGSFGIGSFNIYPPGTETPGAQMVFNSYEGGGSYTVVTALAAATPDSGPNSVTVTPGDFTWVNGEFGPASISGNTYAPVSLSNNGTAVAYTDTQVALGNVPEPFNAVEFAQTATEGVNYYAIAIWAVLPETLTITSDTVAYGGGVLEWEGTCLDATLSSGNYSVDSGTFSALTSLTVSGTNYSAVANVGSLSAGSHTVQMEDASTSVLSNVAPFTVSGESITLTAVGGALFDALTFGGHASPAPPGEIDLAVNGTWGAPTEYSYGGLAFTGAGDEITTPGSYTVQVRDHGNTLVVSNTLTLTVGEAESILLTSATGTYGGNLALAGTTFYGPASAMQVKYNNLGAWHAVTDYSTGSGSPAAWTGTGPILPAYGTYPIKVRDATTLVESNTVYLTLSPPMPPPPPSVSVVLWTPAAFPATWLAETIPSYLYVEYQDDDNLQALVAGYNAVTQQILNWFTSISLPIYTGPNVTGALLDWVAEGLYGIKRPLLPSGQNANLGPFNTAMFNTTQMNGTVIVGPTNVYLTSDDIFRRVITWNFYKGDGFVFSLRWLKRRIMRFLYAPNGGDYVIDETYPVSVTFGADYQIDINFVNLTPPTINGAIFNTAGPNSLQFNAMTSVQTPNGVPPLAATFKAAMDAGVLGMPFQFSYIVNV